MIQNVYILVACEFSQTITKAFRERGFKAYSCDLQECHGGHPEWHIQGDCFEVINGGGFRTQDGRLHFVLQWTLVIAHPPCQMLANSGSRYLNVDKYGESALKRQQDREEAFRFFLRFTRIDAKYLAIENPLGYPSRAYRKPDQIIQPWNFGDNVQKSTCLWLRGLPPLELEVTERPEPDIVYYTSRDGAECKMERFFYDTRFLPPIERRNARSKTFPGIANAIAEQWGDFILRNRY